MTERGTVPPVTPMSGRAVEERADHLIRTTFPGLWQSAGPFPVEEMLEFHLSRKFGFEIDVQPLPAEVEAFTTPEYRTVTISLDTYQDLDLGMGRARFTVLHELGHVALHARQLDRVFVSSRGVVRLHRGRLPAYRDPEWQANKFAAALLMPAHHVMRMLREGARGDDLMATFDVSRSAAEIRIEQVRKM